MGSYTTTGTPLAFMRRVRPAPSSRGSCPAGLHGRAVHAYHRRLHARVHQLVHALEHLVGHEVLARAVGLDDCLDRVLRHVAVVRQQLLGVLGQAVAAVAEAGVVVVRADARVQAYAADDLRGVEPAGGGVGVQLVEARSTRYVLEKSSITSTPVGPHTSFSMPTAP